MNLICPKKDKKNKLGKQAPFVVSFQMYNQVKGRPLKWLTWIHKCISFLFISDYDHNSCFSFFRSSLNTPYLKPRTLLLCFDVQEISFSQKLWNRLNKTQWNPGIYISNFSIIIEHCNVLYVNCNPIFFAQTTISWWIMLIYL